MNILGLSLILVQIQLATAEGVVTKPGGTTPLSRATVMLDPVVPSPNTKKRSVVSEEDGRFSIRDIQPGDYRLTVESARFGRASYGQRRPDGPGAILSFAPGRQVSDLRVSMIPTGAIAGRITGPNGEPLVNATVQALKSSYQNGKKILMPAQATMTDDRGEYRLFWLPAGKYVVTASQTISLYVGIDAGRVPHFTMTVPPMMESFEADLARGESLRAGSAITRVLEDGTRLEESWAPIYYPSATEERFATALNVSAGSTVNGVNITVGPARVQKIRGRVVGFLPGSTPTVTLLYQDGATSGLGVFPGRGASNFDGRFEFSGVLPGSYAVVARDTRSGLTSVPQLVEVSDRDIEDLTLGMTPGIDLSVKMVFEASVIPGNSDPLKGISVRLVPDLPGASGRDFSLPGAPNINFITPLSSAIPPGDYHVQGVTSPNREPEAPSLYVKSVKLGLSDATDVVHITAGSATTLEVILTTDSGSVEGTVLGTTGLPMPNATVALVPNARKRHDLYQDVVTGADGRFRFQGIVQADYKLFAWEDVETGAWEDPTFMNSFESVGRLVHVSGRSNESVQLVVIQSR